ncbi:MAG: ferrochelatase [Bacteroidetes bacterium]|nr:MAG: ferrochelatase [Bacteroidota bacterium]
MTPRDFLQRYRFDARMITGRFYAHEPLLVEQGDRVGVVLLYPGGPGIPEDVASFLYGVLMDPAVVDLPLGRRLRPVVCRTLSSLLAKRIGREYEAIGGRSPINRLTREQAVALETRLNLRYGKATGVSFHAYPAARYGHPSFEVVAMQMESDGIDKVVLLPLYPQYAKMTTGSALCYWWTLEQAGEIPSWPTTFAFEYAAHPKYVQALSERIDEALQRFPRAVRSDVHLVFTALATPMREMTVHRDPYCCLVHSTVDRVMAHRGHDLPFHVTFQSMAGLAEWLAPETEETVVELARQGARAVLMVPVSFVSDRLETVYRLDVRLREKAEQRGLVHFEVTSGLNCHPLFIEALSEVVLSQIRWPESVAGVGDGVAPYAICPVGRAGVYAAAERQVRCTRCPMIAEAARWEERPGEAGWPGPAPKLRNGPTWPSGTAPQPEK